MSEDTSTSPNKDETFWAALCHVCAFLGGLIFPCNLIVPIVILISQKDSPFVRSQAKEALNFQISIVLWAIISFFLCLVIIGIPMLMALAVADIVLPIVAAISAADGKNYRYPLTFRFIK